MGSNDKTYAKCWLCCVINLFLFDQEWEISSQHIGSVNVKLGNEISTFHHLLTCTLTFALELPACLFLLGEHATRNVTGTRPLLQQGSVLRVNLVRCMLVKLQYGCNWSNALHM